MCIFFDLIFTMEHAKNFFLANEANVVKCSTKQLILDIYEVSFQRKY